MATAQITNTASDTSWGGTVGTAQRGNSFTPASDYYVSEIAVKMYRNVALGTGGGIITCSISDTSGGKPTGAALGTATMNCADVTENTAGAVYTFTFASPVSVTNGTMYALHIGHNDADGTLYVRYGGNNYAGGTSLYYDGATWTAGSSYDYYFIISSPSATYVDAEATISGTSVVTATATVIATIDAAATITGSGSITAYATANIRMNQQKSRLIAVGYNELWYEDI